MNKAIYLANDSIGSRTVVSGRRGAHGVAIHPPRPEQRGLPAEEPDRIYYSLYTDDGRGNGDFLGYAHSEEIAVAFAHGYNDQ